jgi:hypothetical protein
MKAFFIIAFALCSGLAHATCPTRPLGDPYEVSLNTDSVLIVTHASAKYDPRFSSKYGVDLATSFARKNGIPMVYLQDDYGEQDYFTEECAPEYWVFSANGELGFQVQPSHVYVAGGHLEQCLFSTVHDVVYSWSEQPERDLTLTFLMDAIYSNGDLIRDTDDFYAAFNSFLRVLTHGRTEDDPWPKVTLLETMGLISQQQRALEYLRRVLPDFENTLPADYRVELLLNDTEASVLQDAPAWNSPTLRFRFVDSARKLDAI